jgi:hypothetical protein
MDLFTQGNTVLQQIGAAMREIGYRGNLLRQDFSYSEIPIGQNTLGTINLAGFAQEVPSYRNSCIGVVVANSVSGERLVEQHRALGAPLIFEVTNNSVRRWKVTKSGAPEYKDSIAFNQISKAFDLNKSKWGPDLIFRAKAIGEVDFVQQLDFFDAGLLPLLEGQVYKKLDRLLRNLLSKIRDKYKEYNDREPDYKDLFRLVFRLIAAKVMRDRGHKGGWESSNVSVVLRAVEDYYTVDRNKLLPFAIKKQEVLDLAWDILSNAFHFQNLSVDDLAFIYESTFITPQTRKTLGTHSTPPRIVEYIVQKLPFEDIEENNRYVLEPCAGHGGFLVSAMRKMRELLGEGVASEDQHNYLVQRLAAIEIEDFAREVCWLRLVLADYPNPNGWQIHKGDVFKGNRLRLELEKASIVLCNPPFEDFSSQDRKYYQNVLPQKPAELLSRVIRVPPQLLGLILPRNFESGSSYRRFHSQLAATYDRIELIALPKVFNYSDAATTILLASGRKEVHAPVSVTCRRVGGSGERDAFLYAGVEPIAISATFLPTDYSDANFSLWIPPLFQIWDYLEDYPRLGSIADIHRGINWKSQAQSYKKKARKVISQEYQPDHMKGYARVENHLEQYRLYGAFDYLSMRESDQYDNAYQYLWDQPKVVCNTARLSRGLWRIGAAADPEGLAFSQRFFGIWPTDKATIYAIAALLNSPLANAYVYAKEEDRDNRVKTLNSLPIPQSSSLVAGSVIDKLSRELHKQFAQGKADECRELLLKIDAEILSAYNLPSELERELIKYFEGYERPVPFSFFGYDKAYALFRGGDQAFVWNIERYHSLVNRMFIEELNENELNEIERLKHEISNYNAPSYEKIIEELEEQNEMKGNQSSGSLHPNPSRTQS